MWDVGLGLTFFSPEGYIIPQGVGRRMVYYNVLKSSIEY